MRQIALALVLLLCGCAGQKVRDTPLGSTPQEAERFEAYEFERVEYYDTDGAKVGDVRFLPEDVATYFESQDAFEAAQDNLELFNHYKEVRGCQKSCERIGMYVGCIAGFTPLFAAGSEGASWVLATAAGGSWLGYFAGHSAWESSVKKSGDKLKENVDLFDQVLRRKYSIPKDYPGGLDLR